MCLRTKYPKTGHSTLSVKKKKFIIKKKKKFFFFWDEKTKSRKKTSFATKVKKKKKTYKHIHINIYVYRIFNFFLTRDCLQHTRFVFSFVVVCCRHLLSFLSNLRAFLEQICWRPNFSNYRIFFYFVKKKIFFSMVGFFETLMSIYDDID